MGYHHARDAFSDVIVKRGFPDADVTSAVQGEIIDREVESIPHSCQVVVTGDATISTADTDTTLEVTVVLDESGDNFSSEAEYASKTVSVGAASASAADFCVVVPFDLFPADQYIRPEVTIALGGTGTLTAALASCSVSLGGFLGQRPHADYDRDDGYDDTTTS